MLDAKKGGQPERKMWQSVGGLQTLGSYGASSGKSGTLDDVPDLPIPDGLDLRAIPDDEAGRKAVWAALVDAFRDLRDEPEASEEDWRQFRDEPKHDTSLWVIAFDGDEIAGGALGLVDPELIAHHGVQRGYVDAVFTRRPWRRRGLARAAVARVLARFRDRGMTSAFLEVDGLNPNQAMGLYESLGFAIVTTSTDWSKPLPDDHEDHPVRSIPFLMERAQLPGRRRLRVTLDPIAQRADRVE